MTTDQTPEVPATLLELALAALEDHYDDTGDAPIADGLCAVLAAVLPEHERQVRRQASAEIMAKAEAFGIALVGPRASFRRGLQTGARRILPPPTPQEIADAIANGDAVICHPKETETR